MKLIKLKCPSCGSNLEINKELKSFRCNYCGTTSLVDDEVIKVEHRIVGTKKKERIEALEALVEDKRYDVALKKAEKLTEDYPQESRVWLALLLTLTKHFTKKYDFIEWRLNIGKNKWRWEDVFDYYSKYEKDKEKLDEISSKYQAFNNEYYLAMNNYFKESKSKRKRAKIKKISEVFFLSITSLIFLISAVKIFTSDIVMSIICYLMFLMLFAWLRVIIKK